MIGKKNLYIAGMVIFTIGSVLCGLSPTIYWLIAFRVLQAIGASILMALGTAMVTEAFPDNERGKALGILGTLVSIGIIAGPTIGGLLLESLSWHWLFFVNLPVGVIGVILVVRYVPASRPGARQKFDFPGALTLFIGLSALLFALSSIQTNGFNSPSVFVLLGVFIVALVVFILIETHVHEPMIDLSIFKNRLFTVNLVTGFMTFIVSAGTTIILPLYLQNVLSFGPRQSGLMLAITPLIVALIAPLAGTLSDRIGSRVITSLGLTMLLIGQIAVSSLGADTTVIGYLLRFIPVGIGIGLFQAPNNSAVMGSVPREHSGVASSLLSLTRTVGQTTGIAVLGAFWERRVSALAGGKVFENITLAPINAQVGGLRDTIYLVIVIIFVALCLSLWALSVWWRERRKTAPQPGRTD
jgi:EmrB/QacA subfamily drug resistance transporter